MRIFKTSSYSFHTLQNGGSCAVREKDGESIYFRPADTPLMKEHVSHCTGEEMYAGENKLLFNRLIEQYFPKVKTISYD